MLLQVLCKRLVDIANRDMRKKMRASDLDEVLKALTDRDAQPFSVFWGQFCREKSCRDTLRALLRGETPANRAALRRLREHGYLNRAGDGLRVPLFERWLREFADEE